MMEYDLKEFIEMITRRETLRIAGNRSSNYHPRFSLPYTPISVNTVRANSEIERLKKLGGPKISIHEPYVRGRK